MAIRSKGGAVAVGAACALFAVACSSSSSSSKSSTATTAASGGSSTTAQAAASGGPWGWPGNSTEGWLAPNQPDVNKDGKVVIAIISPGDTHDKGYYESFVDAADTYAKDNGWTVITDDKVPDSQAAQ